MRESITPTIFILDCQLWKELRALKYDQSFRNNKCLQVICVNGSLLKNMNAQGFSIYGKLHKLLIYGMWLWAKRVLDQPFLHSFHHRNDRSSIRPRLLTVESFERFRRKMFLHMCNDWIVSNDSTNLSFLHALSKLHRAEAIEKKRERWTITW